MRLLAQLRGPVFVTLGILISLMPVACNQHISDRDLLRRAETAGRSAAQDDQWYIFSEIAKNQALRGYYQDAAETSQHVDKYPDQLLIELVSIRAKNGDIAGAKSQAISAIDNETKLQAQARIGLVQAQAGDIAGARETISALPARLKQDVLESIGIYETDHGDIEGALKTVASMEHGWGDAVLAGISDKLRQQGSPRRALQIAKQISDPYIARASGVKKTIPKEVTGDTPKKSSACDLAWEATNENRLADAKQFMAGQHCDCNVALYLRRQEGDAAGAERAARTCDNPADVSASMAELAEWSAARGDIAWALRFADEVHVTGAYFEDGYLSDALRKIARVRAKQEPLKKVLAWAESRPTGFDRSMAILGIVEASGPRLPE